MMPDPASRSRTRSRAAALIGLTILLAPALAGCTDGGGGDGGDMAPDIPDEVLALFADCAEARQAAGDGGDRPVCNPDNPVAVLNTSMGEVRIELFTDVAPVTAGNFANLTRDGFYDGTRFHRVIENFVIQDGDPLSKDTDQKDRWGTGGPGYEIRDEWPCQDGTIVYEPRPQYGTRPTHCDDHGGLLVGHDGAGVLSMANSGPNTGGSQYFITLADQSQLDGYHPVFGQVVGGMDVVSAIGQVETDDQDRPVEDVVIHSVTLEGDA